MAFAAFVCTAESAGAHGSANRHVSPHPTTPEAWGGTWEVTVAWFYGESDSPFAVDTIADTICPGEPLVPEISAGALHCLAKGSTQKIRLRCLAHVSLEHACHGVVDARLDSRRDGDSWNGEGRWKVKVVGRCPPFRDEQTVVITGTRISSDQSACADGRESLVQRFFQNDWLIYMLAPDSSSGEDHRGDDGHGEDDRDNHGHEDDD